MKTQAHVQAPSFGTGPQVPAADDLDAAGLVRPAGPELLIVDDQASVRQGVVDLANTLAVPWRGVFGVSTAEAARERVARVPPDIVILDADLAGDDGLRLLPELAAQARVIVLTAGADAQTRRRAASLGASALVDKSAQASELAAALMTLATPRSRGDQPPIRGRA